MLGERIHLVTIVPVKDADYANVYGKDVSDRKTMVKSVKIKRTLRIKDAIEDLSFVNRRSFTVTEELQPVFSELVVPVLLEDAVIAVVKVESSQLNAFTNEDQELLETLIMPAASALGRARLCAGLC
nr:GAF domain-containing protein [Candidatus Njordarchaeum guaymaensis]